MINFLKTASGICASNYERLSNCTDKSKTKVIALTIALLVPVLIWMVCGFMLPFCIMQKGLTVSIISAVVIGLIIFTIERLVLISNGHWAVATFRIALAGSVAWLGTSFIDQVIFKDDIDHIMPLLKHQEALEAQQMSAHQFAERNNMTALDSTVKSNYKAFEQRQDGALKEAGGLADLRIKGAGSATRFKQYVANKAFLEYQKNKELFDTLASQSALIQVNAYDSAAAKFNDRSLLYRIKALNVLLSKHSEMTGIYWGITFLLFMLEFLVVIFKITWPKTAYEMETEMLDDLHRQRTNRMRSASPALYQDHFIEPTLRAKSRQLGAGLNSLI